MNIFTALFRRKVQPMIEPRHEMRPNYAHYLREVASIRSIPDLIETMCHPYGYLRQAAIGRAVTLADADLLPAIARRLNDWVPQVRDAARSALITLLPVMPTKDIIGLLPAIMKLRSVGRSDHSEWLVIFERDLLKWVQVADLRAGMDDDHLKIARACFDILQRNMRADSSALILAALATRRDIVIALQAARTISTLALESQDALYQTALRSRFGAVRTAAVRALLCRPFCEATRELAADVLLDRQSSVRGAAIAHLQANAVDVASYYRHVLETPATPAVEIRICLSAIAGLGNGRDVSLVKSFLANQITSIRMGAYSAWLRLAENEKDEIAALALTDQARTIRVASFEMTRRRGAFIRFDTVCAALAQYQDWTLLLRFARLEKWNMLEAIARIALATGPADAIRTPLENELAEWIKVVGSYTRPTDAQVEFLLAARTSAVLSGVAPKNADFPLHLERELAIARGKRS